ncbi:MAG: sigma-70 family RNA polymerase sigma factor [Phycisphaerae bacterium]|nr:sigma-70 family RNA polymerase sigma factor [Gemmatimonadaceae bacterium]
MSIAPRPAVQWVEQQYEELRRLAHAQLRRERTGHTLSTTGLVNEAYLRLAQQHSLDEMDRSEFFAAAAVTMRRILVDFARTRLRAKRGGGAETVSLDAVSDFLSVQEAEEFVALDEALDRLRVVNPRGAEVVQYRFFAGLSLEETATALTVSMKTVQRDWLTARAWLTKEVSAVVSALDAE